MAAGGLVRDFVVSGIDHAVSVVALEHEVERSAAQARHRQRTARMERVHLAADIELAVDDAERAAAAECLQIEVVDFGLAGPVKGAGQIQQLAAHVGAERL